MGAEGFSSVLKGYLAPDKNESHLQFHGGFSKSLAPFLSAASDAGYNIGIYSGYRSPEHQGRLYNDALEKYGSPEAARKWVAPPGKSMHNFGLAADLSYGSDAARAWAHENAPSFGLAFRMAHEPWHIELNPDDKREALTAFVERDDGIGKKMIAAVAGEPKPDVEQPSVAASAASKNEELSLDAATAAAEEPEKQVQETYEPQYMDTEYLQEGTSQALNNIGMKNIYRGAVDFFNSLSPQQRMVESQAYMTSRRLEGEKGSIQEWFATKRFPIFVTGFTSRDPQTLENLSREQKQALEKAARSLGNMDQAKLAGVA